MSGVRRIVGGSARAVAIAGALLGAWSGCAPERTLPPGSLDPVVIGLATSTEGGLRSAGPEWLKAALLAVNEVNAAGGVLPGRLIDVVVLDDETNPDLAEALGMELLDAGAVGFVGSAASSITLGIAAVTTPAQIPQISCCSTSDNITAFNAARPPEERYLFRTAPTDALQARVVSIAAQDLACTRPAVLHLDDAYGMPFGEAIERELEADGMTVVIRVPFRSDQASYATEVQQVAATGPDCVAMVAFEVSAGQILRDWSSLATPPDVRWIGTDGVRVPGFVDEVGDPNLIREFYGTAPVTDASTPAYNAFADAFRTVYGTAPIPFASNNYDAVALLALGIARAGTTDGPAVRDAILEVASPPPETGPVTAGRLANALEEIRAGGDVDYQGASGNTDIGPDHDVVTPYEIWRYDPPTSTEPCESATQLGNDRGSFCRARILNSMDLQE